MAEFIDVDTAAERYCVSAKTIRRRISDGTIPAYRVGRLIRIRVEDLDSAFRRIPSASIGAA
jgi:excisionase family DNA binding protein